MENIINKIEIFADSNITIEPSENTTLITGASGEGKTLLFKLITYTLGNDSKIEEDEAKRQFPGLYAIRLTFSNGYIFERKLSKEFEAKITKDDNEEILLDNSKKYREYVGKLFNHQDVKVLKKGNPPTLTTFSVPEYIKTLFFDESRIVSDNTLIDIEGYAEETKLANYYKYFLTGKIIDLSIIDGAKKESKESTEAKKFIKYFSRQVEKPSAAVKTERQKIKTTIEKNDKKLESLINELEEKSNQFKSLMISKNKMQALQALYNSQLSEIDAAKLLDGFMSGAEIVCEKCGHKIQWEEMVEPDEEKVELLLQLKEIDKTLLKVQKEIETCQKKIKELKVQIEGIQKETYVLSQRIAEIDKLIYKYDIYEKSKAILDVRNKTTQSSYQDKLIAEKEKWDKEFETQMDVLCTAISQRLNKWGIVSKKEVSFDYERFDFKFNGTLRHLLPKGYKGFCSVAMILELIHHMKLKGVPCFNYILIDTVWKVASFENENLEEIVDNFLVDLSQETIQTIIFENEYSGKNIQTVGIKELKI